MAGPLNEYYWCQQSVLVRVREVAQHAERVELRAPDCETLCDGMVWLKPLNDCHVIWMNFREPPSSLGRELARSIYDGELNQILVSDLAVGVPDSELKCQVIERTPEVMEDIAEHQADTREVRAQVRHMADVQDVLSGFRVVLNSESWEIRFDRERLAAVLIEGVDVFLTALSLGPTSA